MALQPPDPLDWTVDDVVQALFDGQDGQRPILGRSPAAVRCEQHIRSEEIDGNCLLTYVDTKILRTEFELPHGLVNRMLQGISQLRLRSRRYQSEYAVAPTESTVPFPSPSVQSLDPINSWRASTSAFTPQSAQRSHAQHDIPLTSPTRPPLEVQTAVTAPAEVEADSVVSQSKKRLSEAQLETQPGTKRRRLVLDSSHTTNRPQNANPAFRHPTLPRSVVSEAVGSSVSAVIASPPIASTLVSRAPTPEPDPADIFPPPRVKKPREDIFFGQKRLPANYVFYRDDNIGEEINVDLGDEMRWGGRPAKNWRDFNIYEPRIPTGQRAYVHHLMQHYLFAAEEIVDRRGKDTRRFKKPYKASLLPLNVTQAITVATVGPPRKSRRGKAKEKSTKPLVRLTLQNVHKWPGLSSEELDMATSQPQTPTTEVDKSEPSCWDYLAKKYPPDEAVLPLYGDSGSENEYDDETMQEIEAEQLEKTTQEYLSKAEVEAVIAEGINNIRTSWQTLKLPKRQLQAWSVWNKARREDNSRDQIALARNRIDHLENNRLPRLSSEILCERWSNKTQLLKQLAVLEQSVFDVEDLKWRISVWKRETAPRKLALPASLKRIRAAQNTDNEEDIGSTDEELDMADFIDTDEPPLLHLDLLEATGREDEMDIAPHVDDEDLFAQLAAETQVSPLLDNEDDNLADVEDAADAESDDSESDKDAGKGAQHADSGEVPPAEFTITAESQDRPSTPKESALEGSDEDQLRDASRTPDDLAAQERLLNDEEAETEIEEPTSPIVSKDGPEEIDKENIPLDIDERQADITMADGSISDGDIESTNDENSPQQDLSANSEAPLDTIIDAADNAIINDGEEMDLDDAEEQQQPDAATAEPADTDDEDPIVVTSWKSPEKRLNTAPAQHDKSPSVPRQAVESVHNSPVSKTAETLSKDLPSPTRPKASPAIAEIQQSASKTSGRADAMVIDLTSDKPIAKIPLVGWFRQEKEDSPSPARTPFFSQSRAVKDKDDDDLISSHQTRTVKGPLEIIDPDVVMSRTTMYYQMNGDRHRFLMRLLDDFTDGDKEALSMTVSTMSRQDLRRGVIDYLKMRREALKAETLPDTNIEPGLLLAAQCFVAWQLLKEYIDDEISSAELKRVLRERGKPSFYRFRRWLREILSHFGYAFIDLAPNYNSEEEKDNRRSSIRKEEELDDSMMDLDEISELPVTPHKKGVRQVKQDVVARERRDTDQRRVKEQQKHRDALHQRLLQSGDTSKRVVINDAYIQEVGGSDSVYLNTRIAAHIQEHQIEGIRFFWRELVGDGTAGCLLSHTMGLGKTMQVISFLLTVAEAATSDVEVVSQQIPASLWPLKALILCPPGLIENWCDEFYIWSGGTSDELLGRLRKISSEVQMSDRVLQIDAWAEHGGVLLIGYEMFRQFVCAKPIARLDSEKHDRARDLLLTAPNIVIADEAHKLKNKKSALAECAQRFETTRRIALTGSPLNNHLEEYWTMINWVAPDYLGPAEEFRNSYKHPIEEGLYADSSTVEKRRARIKLKVLRDMLIAKVNRADISVLPAGVMPPKTEFHITVRLTPLQHQIYAEIVRRLHEGLDIGGVSTGRVWGWLEMFRVLCLHPELLDISLDKQGAPEPDEDDSTEAESGVIDLTTSGQGDLRIKQDIRSLIRKCGDLYYKDVQHSNKMLFLFHIAKLAYRVKEKLLVFSNRLNALNFVEQMLMRIEGITFARLDGSTNMAKRQSAAKEFNTNSADVYLISTKAGGLGLNLQGATRVVILDADWNPTWEEQAVGRAYRIGQKKPVFVYRFKCGGSFEDVLHNRTVYKTQLSSSVVDHKNLQGYSSRDIREYLTPPKELEVEDMSSFVGKDPLILDQILNDKHCKPQIYKMELSETFQRDSEDKLTAEEMIEAEEMRKEEHLKRTDPAAYQQLLKERAAKEEAERMQAQLEAKARDDATAKAKAEADAQAYAQAQAEFMARQDAHLLQSQLLRLRESAVSRAAQGIITPIVIDSDEDTTRRPSTPRKSPTGQTSLNMRPAIRPNNTFTAVNQAGSPAQAQDALRVKQARRRDSAPQPSIGSKGDFEVLISTDPISVAPTAPMFGSGGSLAQTHIQRGQVDSSHLIKSPPGHPVRHALPQKIHYGPLRAPYNTPFGLPINPVPQHMSQFHLPGPGCRSMSSSQSHPNLSTFAQESPATKALFDLPRRPPRKTITGNTQTNTVTAPVTTEAIAQDSMPWRQSKEYSNQGITVSIGTPNSSRAHSRIQSRDHAQDEQPSQQSTTKKPYIAIPSSTTSAPEVESQAQNQPSEAQGVPT